LLRRAGGGEVGTAVQPDLFCSASHSIEPGASTALAAHTFPAAVLRVPAAINQDMKALLPKEGLLPEFLCSMLWAYNSRILELVERSTHDTRKLETKALLDTKIVVPPIREQRCILAELATLEAEVDALKHLQAETGSELDALLPSVLDHAFRGEL
jgi:type I restriction enzyme S subunit